MADTLRRERAFRWCCLFYKLLQLPAPAAAETRPCIGRRDSRSALKQEYAGSQQPQQQPQHHSSTLQSALSSASRSRGACLLDARQPGAALSLERATSIASTGAAAGAADSSAAPLTTAPRAQAARAEASRREHRRQWRGTANSAAERPHQSQQHSHRRGDTRQWRGAANSADVCLG